MASNRTCGFTLSHRSITCRPRPHKWHSCPHKWMCQPKNMYDLRAYVDHHQWSTLLHAVIVYMCIHLLQESKHGMSVTPGKLIK